MIAILLLLTLLVGMWRKVDIFDAFSAGAADGLKTAVRIIPCLAATLTALRIMEASGALNTLCTWMKPWGEMMGIPAGAMPLLVLRPLSGSASLAVLSDILAQYGPDSRTGLVASAMMGSGETVLYTCALYLGAAGVKKSRYIIPASLAGWLVGCAVAGAFFRNGA